MAGRARLPLRRLSLAATLLIPAAPAEPASGALAGLLLLAEGLALPQLVALGCVTGASVGAVLSRGR
ncbi:hypothetical protein ABT324_20340 [Saccharopolyspora sp. NPDC000359]|uniref:hypothetical protein n=1 Tax=Saccharopolyspora sp. NPDC000359 TaxID=3154251 RepID=UPI00332D9EA9